MMSSRISLALVAAVAFFCVRPASALDNYWDNTTGNGLYQDALNWSIVGSPTNTPPSATRSERAVIGTDNPAGLLVGSSTLTASTVIAGGIALGLREFDYDDLVPDSNYINPAPAAGALRGSLTITAGTLNLNTTAQSAIGADGRLLVGVEGRGYLTMTGGTLSPEAMVVAGENFTEDAFGTSLVSLSGTATLNVDHATTPANGTSRFGRRLRVEGPSVNFRSEGNLILEASNSYTAVITSSTIHSPLKTDGTAQVNGSLFVEFSGAGTTHSPGETWTLVDATAGIGGNGFNNLLPGGDVQVSGVPTPAAGLAYRLKRTPSAGHTLLELSYERLLVLNVNRTTGELSITNPHGGPISIDSYSIGSDLGSLVASYDGISGTLPSPPSPNWQKYGLSANNLTEVINNPSDPDQAFNLTSVPTVSLGNGFDRDAVAGDVGNFGTDGEDLEFVYAAPNGELVRGHVVYGNGTKFENNLVLRVNPNTGVARLKNDSLETLVFDGFEITSTGVALNSAGFTAITGGTGTWQTDAEGTTGLSQVNFGGARTLLPQQEVTIGDISSLVNPFDTQAEQDGLSMRFILAEGLEASAATGDYNNDGTVDAVDYTVWRNNFGLAATNLENRDPANTATTVDGTHYTDWKANYGSTGGTLPETAFRIGSLFFDTTLAGAGSGGLAVPEPASAVLLLMGVGAFISRRGRRTAQQVTSTEDQRPGTETANAGVRIMARRIAYGALVALAFVVVAGSPQTAEAVTGGIPITNFDFTLPGPAGTKTIAFDNMGVPIPGIIPGWTFVGGGGGIGEVNGLANEDFGDMILGDSGTEGSGEPGHGQEMLLSTNDGRVYQIAPGHVIANPALNQQYKIGFDVLGIFTIDANQAGVTDGFQLTARVFAGAYPGTTLKTLAAATTTSDFEHFEITIPRNDPVLTPGVIGQSIGVEFDTTSREFNAMVAKSWAGIDNVVFEITGVLPGDLNGDGVVNLTDAANLTPNLQASTPFEAMGELTGDNVVNLNDFRALKSLIAAGSGAGGGGLAGGPSVPEPASGMLALLGLIGAALASARRRFGARAMKLAAVATVSAVALQASTASAELLAYEPFNIPPYTVGALEGQAPESDYFTGNWSIGDAGQVVQAGSLSYLGAPSLGGSVTNTEASRVGVSLAEPWTTAKTGTYYISFLSNYGTAQDPNTTDPGTLGFRAVEFLGTNTAGIGEGRIAEVGFQGFGPDGIVPSQQRLGWVGGPGTGRQAVSDNVFNDFGGTHLIVLKYILTDTGTTAGDTVSIYVDPTSTSEPDFPTASGVTNFTLRAITTNSFFFADIGLPFERPVFDELRIATTYAEALPELPLPGDTDNDGDVDLVDYNNIVSNMNALVDTALEGDVARADGKQGSDGRVTIADYRIWRDNYPTNFTPPGSGNGGLAGVPEPASWFLVLAATANLLAFGRRRAK